MAVVGIVPAGGTGERLGVGSPKAFHAVAGRPLLDWSLDVLAEICDRVVVAVPAGFERPPDRVTGGPSRSASVRNALAAAPEAAIAVVHDAARPLVDVELVQRCIAALERDPALSGTIAATPVTDTIKQSDGGDRVVATLDRESLWAVQTPQVFRASSLRDALAGSDAKLAAATDDAGLVEQAGGTIGLVAATAENLKITTPLDVRIVEALLTKRATASTLRSC